MSTQQPSIIYTLTDEAPRLATASFLPIVRSFTAPAGINVTESDISVAARVLGEFPEYLKEEQRVPNTLAELGKKTLQPDANIIKLPNISASVSQLKAAIAELQSKGYALPDYPDQPKDDKEKEIKARYGKCIGSAVNPVLREGNSDRRAPKAVKEYARKNPHSMAEWSQASRSHVSHMHAGDFYHGEKSMTLDRARDVKMELITKSGKTIILKPKVSLLDREVIDSMFMSKKALLEFYEKEIEDARKTGVMFSLHVKATMMSLGEWKLVMPLAESTIASSGRCSWQACRSRLISSCLDCGSVAILLYRSTMPLLTLTPSSSNSLPCFSNASL